MVGCSALCSVQYIRSIARLADILPKAKQTAAIHTLATREWEVGKCP